MAGRRRLRSSPVIGSAVRSTLCFSASADACGWARLRVTALFPAAISGTLWAHLKDERFETVTSFGGLSLGVADARQKAVEKRLVKKPLVKKAVMKKKAR
jgi:hypothetical protein